MTPLWIEDKKILRLVLLTSVVASMITPLLGWSDELAATGCGTLNKPRDVIECALKNHPEMRQAAAALSQGDELDAVASQRPNPELSTKAVTGKTLGDTVVNLEANLSHTIELGGKRGARIEKAAAERETIATSYLKEKEEVFLGTLTTLYRLRQIQAELHVLDEALDTFTRIQKLFKSRPKLAPEQQVSIGVFQLAEGDYKFRLAALSTEETALLKQLSFALGQTFSPSTNLLPPKKKDWVEPDTLQKAWPLRGSAIKAPQVGLKLAEAELELAKSESWPNVMIGPTVESQTQGPFTYQTYGLNLSFALPLFQVNGGGRAFAYRGIDRAEVVLQAAQRGLNTEREILFQKYKNAVVALKSAVSTAEMERRHHDLERLFNRGMINSQLVIEAHRQMVDFTKSQNEQELSAIEALYSIYRLEGRLFEERL